MNKNEQGIINCQELYINKLTVNERKRQKKESQELHEKLNKLGIKVQLKGINNKNNESIIAIPDNKFILVSMENGLNFMISDDRDGNCIDYYYDTDNQMINDYFEMNLAIQQTLF